MGHDDVHHGLQRGLQHLQRVHRVRGVRRRGAGGLRRQLRGLLRLPHTRADAAPDYASPRTPEAFPATCPAWYDESAYQYPFYYQDDPGADDLPNDVGSIQDGFSVYNGRFTSKFVGMAALAATNLAGNVELCAVVTPLCAASCVTPTLNPVVEERWREWCPGADGYDLTDNQKIVALVSGACGIPDGLAHEPSPSFFSNPEIFYGGGFRDADGNDVLPGQGWAGSSCTPCMFTQCDGCRSDICTDYGEDCCAPGDEPRGCSHAGYEVQYDRVGSSGWGD